MDKRENGKTTEQNIERFSRRRLEERRERLRRALLDGELLENRTLPFFTDIDAREAGGMYPPYSDFLERAAYLDQALQQKHWECADEISEFLMAMKIYGSDKRCVRIVYELLEEYRDAYES